MTKQPVTLSQRALNTPPSPIRRLAHLAVEAKERGTRVYPLNIGQPDIRTPAEFFEGVALFKDEVLAYEQSQGNDVLRRAWAAYTNRVLGLNTAYDQFMITTGASEALIFLFMICCDPGDEVIIFDPTYANYIGFGAIAGVKLVPVPSSLDENFPLPARSAIEGKLSSRTKAILLCNPNNPTGTVYTREEMQLLLNICRERNLFFIVDETYREFVYDDIKPLSILHIAPNDPRVVVVDSLSKRFSLCGARVGAFITSNEELLASALNLAQARLASPTLEQFAAAHMLERISDSFLENVRATYQKRRDTMYACLQRIPGATVRKPRGAFYAVARLPIDNTEDFASYMLSSFAHEGETTFVAPAAGFYMENKRGRDKIRMAYVIDDRDIERAIYVLGLGLEAFRRSRKERDPS